MVKAGCSGSKGLKMSVLIVNNCSDRNKLSWMLRGNIVKAGGSDSKLLKLGALSTNG